MESSRLDNSFSSQNILKMDQLLRIGGASHHCQAIYQATLLPLDIIRDIGQHTYYAFSSLPKDLSNRNITRFKQHLCRISQFTIQFMGTPIAIILPKTAVTIGRLTGSTQKWSVHPPKKQNYNLYVKIQSHSKSLFHLLVSHPNTTLLGSAGLALTAITYYSPLSSSVDPTPPAPDLTPINMAESSPSLTPSSAPSSPLSSFECYGSWLINAAVTVVIGVVIPKIFFRPKAPIHQNKEANFNVIPAVTPQKGIDLEVHNEPQTSIQESSNTSNVVITSEDASNNSPFRRSSNVLSPKKPQAFPSRLSHSPKKKGKTASTPTSLEILKDDNTLLYILKLVAQKLGVEKEEQEEEISFRVDIIGKIFEIAHSEDKKDKLLRRNPSLINLVKELGQRLPLDDKFARGVLEDFFGADTSI